MTHEHSRDEALNPHTPWDKPHLDAANWREFPPTCRGTLRYFPPQDKLESRGSWYFSSDWPYVVSFYLFIYLWIYGIVHLRYSCSAIHPHSCDSYCCTHSNAFVLSTITLYHKKALLNVNEEASWFSLILFFSSSYIWYIFHR